MASQLKWKFIFIAIVILRLYFRAGRHAAIPTSFAQAQAESLRSYQLGLDLKGGSHLVLQVQVDEAIGQRCDQAVDQLKKVLHDKNINFGEIRRVDDTHILVRNVDPATSGTFRDLVNDQFTDWTIAPAAGENNGYLLTMKPSVIADLRTQTMDQSLETITRRINALGLTEPTIAFTGRARQRNSRPASRRRRSDPRESRDSGGRAAPTEACRPTSRRILRRRRRWQLTAAFCRRARKLFPVSQKITRRARRPSRSFTCLNRAPIVTGQDLRGATPEPSTNNPGQYEVGFIFPPRPLRASAHSPKPTWATGWPSCSTIRFIRRP